MTLAGAIAALISYGCSLVKVTIPDYIAVAAATVILAIIGYITPSTKGPENA